MKVPKYIKSIFESISPVIRTVIYNLKYPYANIGFGARIINSSLERNVKIDEWSIIINSKLSEYVHINKNNLINSSELGKHTYTGQNTIIEFTQIGNFCSISWNVTIGAAQHDYNRVTSHEMLYSKWHEFIEEPIYSPFEKNVSVGNDVWIGANSIILRGVKVGDGAVIGAGAVVTKDIPDYGIAIGIPAKVVKYRFDKKTINILKKVRWWDFPTEIIKKNLALLSSSPTQVTLDKLIEIREKLEE